MKSLRGINFHRSFSSFLVKTSICSYPSHSVIFGKVKQSLRLRQNSCNWSAGVQNLLVHHSFNVLFIDQRENVFAFVSLFRSYSFLTKSPTVRWCLSIYAALDLRKVVLLWILPVDVSTRCSIQSITPSARMQIQCEIVALTALSYSFCG